MNNAQRNLQQLGEQIDARVQAIQIEHDWWPCRQGCDHCCRNLARPLELTAEEWTQVDEAVAALPISISSAIRMRIDALLARIEQGTSTSAVVCPFLNDQEGACYIYALRPIACRTYGFFIARDHNQYCTLIEAELASHPNSHITWGNAEAIRHRLIPINGEPIPFHIHYSSQTPHIPGDRYKGHCFGEADVV